MNNPLSKGCTAFLRSLFPDGILKNKIICLYWNLFRNNDFHISYSQGFFKINKNSHLMIFKGNPYPEFADSLESYFKHYKLNEGDFIVDGGAYTGAFTVYCAKLIGENGRVISFEPDAKNYKVLLENIKLNKVEGRVILIKKGLWNLKSRLAFNKGRSKGARLDFDGDIRTNSSFINLNSLDNSLSELKLKKIAFIKFDIEGAEIEALDGSKRTLKENKCPIAIASYHLRGGEKTSKICEEKLRKIGLKTETIAGRHTTTYGF